MDNEVDDTIKELVKKQVLRLIDDLKLGDRLEIFIQNDIAIKAGWTINFKINKSGYEPK